MSEPKRYDIDQYEADRLLETEQSGLPPAAKTDLCEGCGLVWCHEACVEFLRDVDLSTEGL